MELTQLKQFQAVAESGSITKAAEEMFVTQSAVSKAIFKLEEELDVELFDRSKRAVALNETGKIALKYVNDALKSISELQAAMIPYLKTPKPHSMRFCSAEPSAFRVVLPAFKNEHPEVNISYEIINEQSGCAQALRDKLYDFAFVYNDPPVASDIYSMPLYEDRVLIRVPLNHPLASKNTLTPQDIDGEAILVLTDSKYAADDIEDFQQKNGVKINFIREKDFALYYSMLETNKYISYSTYVEMQNTGKSLNSKYIPLKGKNTVFTYYVSYLKENQKLLKTFIDFVREDYKKIDLSVKRKLY